MKEYKDLDIEKQQLESNTQDLYLAKQGLESELEELKAYSINLNMEV